MFLFPRLISFHFCYDLEIGLKVKEGLISFSLECVLSLFGQVYNGNFDQTWQEAS